MMIFPLFFSLVWSAAMASGLDPSCPQERSESSALLQTKVASAKTELAKEAMESNQAPVDCAQVCRDEGYCCNDDVGTGGNQYLSCFQACNIRQNGADEGTCLGHCADVAVNRGCSRTIDGVTYGMCSSCADLTSDDKCKWSVGGPEACEFGCTMTTTTTTTRLDCAQVCRDEGYCCNDDVAVGGNQYLSCFQACDIRQNGADEATCLGHCAEVAANRGCSRTIAGVTYGMCWSCADLTNDDKCTWSVRGPDACEFGCKAEARGPTTTTTTTTLLVDHGLTVDFYFNLPNPRSTRVLTRMQPRYSRVDPVVNYPPSYSSWPGIKEKHVVRFGAIWSGSIIITEAGEYTFYLKSDTGSILELDGNLTVDNDGLHRIVEEDEKVWLSSGPHDLKLKYFQRSQGSCMIFSYSGPDTHGDKVVVPSLALRP